MDDEDLWSDEINAFVDRAFETVSLSPSFYGEVAAYRYAIKLAIDEGRQTQTDALKIAREAFEAIIARGPERDFKWTGMTPRDIALNALAALEQSK